MTIHEQCPPEERRTIQAFLSSQSTLVLATTCGDDHIQSAPLFFVSDDDFYLYWLSSENSAHSVNIMSHPQSAASIYPVVWHWQQIRGLQIEGITGLISDVDVRERALALYRGKFDLPAMFDQQIAASRLYVLRPTWLRWIDNRVKFGHRLELSSNSMNNHTDSRSSNHNITEAVSSVSPGRG